ncbi:MAG TPA: protein kinase family protein [Streptosporangiaceae bacterium]|nr:protein kinase family protein [Streptosporangiaceae bacterium]
MSCPQRAIPGARPAARLARGCKNRPRAVPDPAAPAEVDPIPGYQYANRYRLDDLITSGTSASVWRGTDELLSRRITVWSLGHDEPVSLEVIAAVLSAAGFTDPRFARIFDADCGARSPYIVTEWAQGEHLDDLLSHGLPDPWTAATVATAAAGALATAHDTGRAHLCLTPRSVLLSGTGLKITGLGIEAALSGTTAADPVRADTRALGGLLYAMLTGYWPGTGETALPPAPRHRGVLCSPGQARGGVPHALDAVASRALAAPGHEPIETAAQLATELRLTRRTMRPVPVLGEFAA